MRMLGAAVVVVVALVGLTAFPAQAQLTSCALNGTFVLTSSLSLEGTPGQISGTLTFTPPGSCAPGATGTAEVSLSVLFAGSTTPVAFGGSFPYLVSNTGAVAIAQDLITGTVAGVQPAQGIGRANALVFEASPTIAPSTVRFAGVAVRRGFTTGGAIQGQVVNACGSADDTLVYIPGRSFLAKLVASGAFELNHVPEGTYDLVLEVPAQPPHSLSNITVTGGATTDLGQLTVPNLATDLSNCGSCGHACSTSHVAAGACAAGVCTITACQAGFGDCNGDAGSDGCETDLNTLSNCGSCGFACSTNHVSVPACTAGICTPLVCNAGFDNCNGNLVNDGCETNLNTDPNNCGSCGTVCGGIHVCSSGICQ